jgi:hypothetical protein
VLNLSFVGIAACNIGGVTIHSFAGVGIAVEDADTLASKVKKNKKASGRWLRTKVLIIDEGKPIQHIQYTSLIHLVSVHGGW